MHCTSSYDISHVDVIIRSDLCRDNELRSSGGHRGDAGRTGEGGGGEGFPSGGVSIHHPCSAANNRVKLRAASLTNATVFPIVIVDLRLIATDIIARSLCVRGLVTSRTLSIHTLVSLQYLLRDRSVGTICHRPPRLLPQLPSN